MTQFKSYTIRRCTRNCIPMQVHLDTERVYYRDIVMGNCIRFFFISYKTSAAESKYPSYELEVLAIVRAVKKFRVYLLGIRFLIYTDCKAFEQTMKKKDLCVARWTLLFSEYNCEVRHCAGAGMRHVDALSRYPSVMVIETGIIEHIRNAQKQDSECKLISELLKNGDYDNYVLRNDLIYKFVEGNYLLFFPKKMQREIIKSVHDNGHIGAAKVEKLIRQDYDIPKLSEKVKCIIKNCVNCILAARKAGKQEGLLNPIDKLDMPLHTYHVDHVGPLSSTAKGYKYLFVIVDAFTKFSFIQ